MTAFTIRHFAPDDEQPVVDLILPIQRDEFGIAITEEDQPDLRAIPSFYQIGTGRFLVAEAGGQIVGTIALKDIGDNRGALRKMFVSALYRGREVGVAQALLDRLIADARVCGIGAIFLGTTERFLAAHRFYEKAGFVAILPDELPERFPRVAVDTRFYRLTLQP